MNKKLFLKLGLLLLALSLVACGQKNNSVKEDNSSKSSENQSIGSTQNSDSSVKNGVESKQEDEDVQTDTQQDTQTDTQQEATEKEYYDIIKEAMQKQIDYINSIDDPKVKQSVQSAQSAAIGEASALELAHPEDSDAIKASLAKVLAGE